MIFDRLEGNIAVCVEDSGESRDIPAGKLPPGARPGDTLRENSQGELFIDTQDTEARRARIAQKAKNFWK